MFVIYVLMVVVDVMDNVWIVRYIKDMCLGIECGESLLRMVCNSEMFIFLIFQMIVVGEEIGLVDDMFNNVVDFYDEEVDYGFKWLVEFIELIFIVVMGVLVFIFVFGVFLLIWDLGVVVMGCG